MYQIGSDSVEFVCWGLQLSVPVSISWKSTEEVSPDSSGGQQANAAITLHFNILTYLSHLNS